MRSSDRTLLAGAVTEAARCRAAVAKGSPRDFWRKRIARRILELDEASSVLRRALDSLRDSDGRRAIVLGSKWMFNGCPGGNETPGLRVVDHFGGGTVHTAYADDSSSGTNWSTDDFYELHTWVSDPPVSEGEG